MILLNSPSTHITPEVVPETQCGFRGNRSTVDMIFGLRQLQGKCIEQDRPLYMVFVDFSKAFDTIGRTGAMAATEEVWMPREVHNYGRGSTYRNDGECLRWRGSLGIVQCYKWGQARLCTHAPLHLPISNARRGFPRLGRWRKHTVRTES